MRADAGSGVTARRTALMMATDLIAIADGLSGQTHAGLALRLPEADDCAALQRLRARIPSISMDTAFLKLSTNWVSMAGNYSCSAGGSPGGRQNRTQAIPRTRGKAAKPRRTVE